MFTSTPPTGVNVLRTAALLLGGAARVGVTPRGRFVTYIYVGGRVAADVALLILYIRMERHGRAPLLS
jgi:hypothetical protein